MTTQQPASVRELHASDTWRISMESTSAAILFLQASGLLDTLRCLHEIWKSAAEAPLRPRLAVAITLVGHAAAEAVLSEWTQKHAGALYKKHKTERPGLVLRAEEVFVQAQRPRPENLSDLCELSSAKNAITHSEPDNSRGGRIGNWIAGDGPDRTVRIVQALRDGLHAP